MKEKSIFSIIWLLSYISIASVSAAMITPALPAIQSEFSLNLGEIEWVVSAFLVGYVLGQLVYAPLANSYGRLRALKWGLDINLLGLLLCLLAYFYPRYEFLILGRFVTGLGSAAGLTCTFMLINEWLPDGQRKAAMAHSILSFALGVGLAVMLGGVITQYVDWQGCFVFLMFQGIVARIGVRVFDETLQIPKRLQLKTLFMDYWQALRSPKLFIFSTVLGGCSAVAYCYAAAGPQVAHDYFHLSAAAYGYWNGVNIIGMLLGGFSARMLLQHLKVMQLLLLGYAGCFVGLLALFFIWQTGTQSVFLFFLATCLLYWFSTYFFVGGSYIASNAIEDKASASSMMSFLNMSTAMLSVVVMGYISNNPLVAFIVILSGVFLVTLGLMGVFFKLEK